ncbi:DNA polymerase III subunit gamma and tau [Dietzia sp. 179-F 9C3 NHS]|uniref:DNA polymerase III subunit gamma and tau n=1 Tax=Dietzia sp. 179-F 9C3 NHS TaxID=3374295 RepID=UPI00387A6AFF
MALYRKYRPASFAEVVGQEHVTEPLSVALSSGRINHAYLFSGPRGCGKTSSARILARSLNCEQGPTADPCGVCESCVALAPGGPGTLDVTELDAASHGGVDDTRDLRERAFFAPASSRYRVLIIDEAHMVTTAGFNALLKIVEEPPEHLIFVFATTEPEKVLPTIRSRTHHYPFRLLTPSAMRGLVERICDQEGVAVEPTVLPLVIRAGGGSPRDTLSVLDQLMAGAGEDGITYPRAVSLLGATEVALIDDTVDALAAGDGATLFRTVDKVVEAGHDPRRFAADLLQRLRDLIMVQSVPQAIERGLVDAPVEQADIMRRQAEQVGPATLARCADMVHEGMSSMRGATSPRLLLEILCAKLLLPGADDSMAALLQRVEQLEAGTTRPAAAAPAQAPAGPGQAPPSGAPAAPGGPVAPAPAPSAAAPEGRPKFVRRSQQAAAQARAPESEAPATAPPAPEAQVPAAPAPTPAAPAAGDPWREPEGPSAPEPTPPVPPVPTEPEPAAAQPEPAAATSGVEAEDIRRAWPAIRDAVRSRTRTVEVMLAGATVAGVDGRVVHLVHDYAPLAKRLSQPHNAGVIAEAIAEVVGGDWTLRCTAGPGPAGAGSSSSPGSAPVAPAATPSPGSPPAGESAEPTGWERRVRSGQGATGQQDRSQDGRRSPGGGYDDVPPPPEEPEPEPGEAPPPPVSEDEMMDEARSGPQNLDHRTGEDIALQLLREHLGARPIER